MVAYIGAKGGQLPAIKTTRREDIEESPVILDGGRIRKNGSKNSTRSIVNPNIQHSLSIAKDAFSETARLQERITYQQYQIQNYKVEVYQK